MKKTLVRITISVAMVFAAHTLSFGQTLSKTLPLLFGKDYADFQWLDYPLDNYGVGTMYLLRHGKANDKIKLKDVDLLCDTFRCFSIAPAPTRPGATDAPERDAWYRVANTQANIDDAAYAAVGCGPEITDIKDLAKHSKITLGAVLPLVLKTAGINSNASYENSVQLNGQLAIECRRSIYADKMEAFLKALPDSSKARMALNSGTLIVVVYDLLLQSINLTVDPKSTLAAKLDSSLHGQPDALFGKGATVTVEVSKTTSGEYKLRTTKPMIVAFLARQQAPGAGAASASLFKFNVAQWQNVAIKPPKP